MYSLDISCGPLLTVSKAGGGAVVIEGREGGNSGRCPLPPVPPSPPPEIQRLAMGWMETPLVKSLGTSNTNST